MKKSLILLSFLSFAVIFAQTAANLTEFKENIAAQKVEAKSQLKPYRFDGSKITYFNFKTYKQVKEVEVYLFNSTDYRFSFNGKSLNSITCAFDIFITLSTTIIKNTTKMSSENIGYHSTLPILSRLYFINLNMALIYLVL
jgi:hypothetical protein